MSMFPGAGAQVYRNEAGEPVGWDYPSDPNEDPGDPYDDYGPRDRDEDFCSDCGEEIDYSEHDAGVCRCVRVRDSSEPYDLRMAPDAHLEMEYEDRFDIGDSDLEM